jgi:hypothetical protein
MNTVRVYMIRYLEQVWESVFVNLEGTDKMHGWQKLDIYTVGNFLVTKFVY